ncbi:MAG: FAD-dependent monooxygenase [Acidimicrobiales bacterium]
MRGRDVVIAGAGPTGMMLAGELALAGVDLEVIEPRASHDLDSSRARGLHSRTIEVLDQRGIAERFLAEGKAVQVQAFGGISLDISDFPTRHPYGLALSQRDFERILAGWVDELGVPITRERWVTRFSENDAGVDVELSDGRSLRAGYLVGCDGGRSTVRKRAGIDFPGWDATASWVIAEVETEQDPVVGLRPGGGIGRLEDGRVGIALRESSVKHSGEPTLADVKAALVATDGTDYGVYSPTFISRFTDMTRQAASYRKGRVLLAGDAAHVHPPQGGQGLGVGVQDAVNLGWKLAQVVKGTSPDSLLDTYHAERHPVGARVARNTMAQVALSSTGARTEALRETVAELLSMDEPRRRFAAMMSGLDVCYDFGGDSEAGHPLLGRRMPDLDLVVSGRPVRVFELLHEARGVLLTLGQPGAFDATGWADRVDVVDAHYDGIWELPLLGKIAGPGAVLVRPDGHVAWVGNQGDEGLADALATWFGPRR